MSLSPSGSTTNQSMLAITNYDCFKNDVLSVLESNVTIADAVQKREASYNLINIRDHFVNLTSVGELVGVAYASTKGFKCNVQVIQLLTNYQSFGTNTQLATKRFLMASMRVLEDHRTAFILVQKHQPTKAINMLGYIANVADEMTIVARKLETEATAICDLAKEALVAASTDRVMSTTQQNAVQAIIRDLQTFEATQKAEVTKLADHLDILQEHEPKPATQADDARSHTYMFALVNAILGPLNSVAKAMRGRDVDMKGSAETQRSSPSPRSELVELSSQREAKRRELDTISRVIKAEQDQEKKKALETKVTDLKHQIQRLEESRDNSVATSTVNKLSAPQSIETDSATELEAMVQAERAKLEIKERQANMKLAVSLANLRRARVNDNTLDIAVHALDLAIKSLDQIKTVFNHIRAFWSTVKEHCDELVKDGQNMVDVDGKEEEFANILTNSWYSWMALAKINYYTNTSMKEVMNTVDNVMMNLPTIDQVPAYLDRTITKLEIEYLLKFKITTE